MSKTETFSRTSFFKRKFTKGQKIVLGIFAVIILYLLFTVAWPLLRGSGLSNYSGAQNVAAFFALEVEDRSHEKKFLPEFIYHVDSVRPTTPDEVKKYCSDEHAQYTDDPSDWHHYTVTISVHSFFALTGDTHTYNTCRFTKPYLPWW